MTEIHPIVIVDMQKSFTERELKNHKADEVTAAIVKVIDGIKDANHPIFLTMDVHGYDFKDTLEGKHFPPHCLAESEGKELDDRIVEAIRRLTSRVPFAYVQVLPKHTFGLDKLPAYISNYVKDQKELVKDAEIKDIEICGLVSSICVISNALILRTGFPDLPIRLNHECTAGLTYEDNEAALTVMKTCLINVY